ncbi:hypothetical protein [Roseateles flavus]|uniref:Pyocin activator protein PrtN n=1 Tax=Roseateles flavus TaxID=3149041 RepID=A0ABV0G8C4_9BURK
MISIGAKVPMGASFKDDLLAEYGPFMPARAICKLLHYPTVGALTAAKKRGSLPFAPLALKGRPGIYAATEEIAEYVLGTLAAAKAMQAQAAYPEEANTLSATRKSIANKG